MSVYIGYSRSIFTITFLVLSVGLLVTARTPDCSTVGCVNGRCVINSGCVCREGWYGPLCQYCGGRVRLTESSGNIVNSPGGINRTCSWLVETKDSGSSIYLRIEHFDSTCGNDSLYIHDGDSVYSPLITTLSGVMYQRGEGITRIPEVVARSGFAYIHLSSHNGINNFDFRISYRMNSCYTAVAGQECSGHGKCHKGSCACRAMYTGAACDVPLCPNNCNNERGTCNMISQRCVCKEGFKGEDCGQDINRGVWELVRVSDFNSSYEGSASQSCVIWNKKMYLLSGESHGGMKEIKSYNLVSKHWEREYAKGLKYPEARYAYSSVLYGDKIYIYGGVKKDGTVTNELWAYDISSHYWDDISVEWKGPCKYICAPPNSTGHTATSIISDSGTEQMVIIFGYSPDLGYLNIVQQFHFGSRKWSVVNTNGFPVTGRYGHSSAWDPLTKNIYVFGGYSSYGVSSITYSYSPSTKTWKLLMAAPSSLVLHSATIISAGVMLIYGGNSFSRSKCYSPEILTYDIICDTWSQLKVFQKPIQANLARYGHSAAEYKGSLYIIGGFNGHLEPQILKFSPGRCSSLSTMSSCLNYQLGVKCVWNSEQTLCREFYQTSIVPQPYDTYSDPLGLCLKESALSTTEGIRQCSQLRDCISCTLELSYQCTWCDDGTCQLGDCGNNFPISNHPDSCPVNKHPECDKYDTCVSCAIDKHCAWVKEKCEAAVSEPHTTVESCPVPCANLPSCTECTVNENCVWCDSKRQCLERRALFIMYPYSQCISWTTDTGKCSLSDVGFVCYTYTSCDTCINDPSCGWYSSSYIEEGHGICLPGGSRGPITLSHNTSMSSRWHFTKCPACQCNGHSNCESGKNICMQPCKHYTEGKHCDKCIPGYFGKPVNGGQCFSCICKQNITECHADTGQCYCDTVGVVGYFCEDCDVKKNYVRDRDFPGTCFYNLTANERFFLQLGDDVTDQYYMKINFLTSVRADGDDAVLSVVCTNNTQMRITVRTSSGSLRLMDRYEFILNGPSYKQTVRAKGDGVRVIYVQLHDIIHPADIEVTLFVNNSSFPHSSLKFFLIILAVVILLLTELML